MNNTKRIEIALDRCRKAFANYPCKVNQYVWCCHHDILFEKLTERAEKRICYILEYKSVHEHESRFNNFRPVKRMDEIQNIRVKRDKAKLELIKLSRLSGESFVVKFLKIDKEYNDAIFAIYKEEVPLGTWSRRKQEILYTPRR